MNISDIIRNKRDKKRLKPTEIKYFVEGITKGTIPDYQASALLMTIYFNGLKSDEIFHLTNSMLHSGKVLNFDEIDGYKVDKHSTGGVGDKISIILGPLVASLGLTVPMISGRGLGHSGGTLDKLESIPGYRVLIESTQFTQILRKSAVSIIGQTENLVPADKKLYALRDVTATVESIPLITASILSKKLAEGINGLVMDVKVGKGAFMKNISDARKLAFSIKKVMKAFKKDCVCILTDMDQPLGKKIGNSLEIEESVEIMKGQGPKDVLDLTLELAAHMLKLGFPNRKLNELRKKAHENIKNGKALEKFSQMISLHGGDREIIENPQLMGKAKFAEPVYLSKSGYISSIDSGSLGYSLCRLGAGREKLTDVIDHTAGIVLNKKIADMISKSEPACWVHYQDKTRFEQEIGIIKKCFCISPKKPRRKKLILETIR